jgi:carboxymethylenebutenolidase
MLSQPRSTSKGGVAIDGRTDSAGRLVYLVGDRDSLIGPDERDQIRAALTDAAVEHELVVYPDTEHAFFWPGKPTFAPAARGDAWQGILRLVAD